MITSSKNPLVRRIRRLRQKKYRLREKAFFIEGLRVTLSAVETQAPIQTIVYSSELLTSELGREAVKDGRASGLDCTELSAQVFRLISGREHPVGLGAIVNSYWTDLDQLDVKQAGIVIALLGVSEPGNLGTIIRTLDAMGGNALILVGQTVDPQHPTAVKASMGTLFNLPVCRLEDVEELLTWAKKQGLDTVASSAHAGQSYREAVFRFPVLLIMGNEKKGLPSEVLSKADHAISIPMRGSASSLNLAVAAGVLLYELRNSVSSRNRVSR